jgi:hypothetical protein
MRYNTYLKCKCSRQTKNTSLATFRKFRGRKFREQFRGHFTYLFRLAADPDFLEDSGLAGHNTNSMMKILALSVGLCKTGSNKKGDLPRIPCENLWSGPTLQHANRGLAFLAPRANTLPTRVFLLGHNLSLNRPSQQLVEINKTSIPGLTLNNHGTHRPLLPQLT